jgi:hypothetical protein
MPQWLEGAGDFTNSTTLRPLAQLAPSQLSPEFSMRSNTCKYSSWSLLSLSLKDPSRRLLGFSNLRTTHCPSSSRQDRPCFFRYLFTFSSFLNVFERLTKGLMNRDTCCPSGYRGSRRKLRVSCISRRSTGPSAPSRTFSFFATK